MHSADWAQRQGHRLIQIGCLLFLVALLVGIMVPSFAVPRLGLSTHLLGITQGIFLMVIGLVWPRLRVSRPIGRAGMFLVLYGCFAPWTANLLAAILGAGNALLPFAAGPARGDCAAGRNHRDPTEEWSGVAHRRLAVDFVGPSRRERQTGIVSRRASAGERNGFTEPLVREGDHPRQQHCDGAIRADMGSGVAG